MKKIAILFISVFAFLANASIAQTLPCGADEATRQLYATNPAARQVMDAYQEQVKAGLKNIDFKAMSRTTNDAIGDTPMWYDVPIVIHIIHDYNNGVEYLTDNYVFNAFKDWNVVYAGANPDTSSVIAPFKKWVGIPRIRLHLATRDPFGNPTKGITRHRSYLTNIGGDQSKLDDWPRAAYVNIWVVNQMSLDHASAAAYAYTPDGAGGVPAWDGVIALYNYIANDYTGSTGISKTINHEMGHVFNLQHPFGNYNSAPRPDCGDDGVDDTPPTHGHYDDGCSPTLQGLYDTACATGYYKIYTNIHGNDSLVDYPDTVNAQNIMDYTYCSRMFTKGQVVRMHDALNNTLAERNNLWDSLNLVSTGALLPKPDLAPIVEYSAVAPNAKGPHYFTCPGNGVKTRINFLNESWNDTISTIRWQFTNSPTILDTTTGGYFNSSMPYYIGNNFTQPGWVTLTMTATDTTGATAGRVPNVTTTVFPNAAYVTEPVGMDPSSYYQEFDPSSDIAKWPIFNYYNNEFKWQLDPNHGYYDNYCIMYTGFDSRINSVANIYPFTGTPAGDFDDFFSIPFDLSSFTAEQACNLNFYYAGASRTSNGLGVNDSMEIQYSDDSAQSWHNLYIMEKNELENNGGFTTAFAPTSLGNWAAKSINIPSGIRTKYTLFRFRYHPGVGTDYYSSGNNFYMDRINISSFPASVSNIKPQGNEIFVAPNPTNGNAFVVLNDNINGARVTVTDITGKVVFTIAQNHETHIEIPHNAIATKGIYIVQTATGGAVNTQKLVVY